MNWRNTWLCGPGAAQYVLDVLEVGPRAAKAWSWGRVTIPRPGENPRRLPGLNPCPPPYYPQTGQMTLDVDR